MNFSSFQNIILKGECKFLTYISICFSVYKNIYYTIIISKMLIVSIAIFHQYVYELISLQFMTL